MACDSFREAEEADAFPLLQTTSIVHTIGQGFCGTVWASEKGPAFKREDGGPDRSLKNEFDMHQRALQSLRKITTLQIRIPACYGFIEVNNQKWWVKNHQIFPPGFWAPCNMIQSQRIPPFPGHVRGLLIKNYCPPNLRQEIITSEPNKDCLVRPYLGRRRTKKGYSTSRFTAFSLRNFPLHLDQIETLMTANDIMQYARVMAETLAMMHWIGEMDGNDIEFVLAPPVRDSCYEKHSEGITRASLSNGLKVDSDALGSHSMWALDFDLCRRITMDSKGVQQAAAAFWRNDPYYPRPSKNSENEIALWFAFKEHYLRMSEACIDIACTTYEPQEVEKLRALPKQVIGLIEQRGDSKT
ncbi:uncharacterized protein N7503_010351 [Penicillium pulvis]|uniref:uncharacterized protein n=1 Tax=Penicillium pulvis TaxID=1562058 RepID=UPI002548F855|nr:uncharacterized protein N7503_010351 [Penicillium pulvis]KAJ5785139.1 hypothetical protein N7503_010351 [Penicillium pulvis]